MRTDVDRGEKENELVVAKVAIAPVVASTYETHHHVCALTERALFAYTTYAISSPFPTLLCLLYLVFTYLLACSP